MTDPEFYARITGDTATDPDSVSLALAEAETALADLLGRGITSAEHTETLRVYSGTAYPTSTPITDYDGPHTEVAISGLSGPTATVTYVGGWEAEAETPWSIRKDIAWNAWRLLHPSQVPPGASSVRVGDVSVTYDGRTHTAELPWSEATMRWRRRAV